MSVGIGDDVSGEVQLAEIMLIEPIDMIFYKAINIDYYMLRA